MAQDLIDKIREQAQARGLDPEVAVRIAQVESSLDPSAKAKTSSAQGLFQVVDKTWKDFGGKPGLKNNPDENIRVGLNILESNTKSLKNALGRDPSPTELYAAHFLGAQGAKTVLSANPDTPVSELLSQRAIKANPTMLKDKSARELIAVLDAKMGMPGSRTTAQPAPTTPQAPMPAATAGAPKRATAPAATPAPVAAQNMGAGYQAALALSFLGDEEEDGQPLSREEWQARTDEKSAADMLAGYKPKNALSEINWDESSLVAQAPPPKRMAEGGEVKEPSLIAVPGYSEMVARDMYPAQQGQFDQQDAARHMLASGTLARKYGPGTAEFLGNAHEIVTSPMRWIGSKLGISQMPVDYEQDLHNNQLGIELARRARSQKELEDLVQVEAERAARERRPGSAWVGRPERPVKRAEGSPETGEVAAPTPEELAAASRPAFRTSRSGIGRNITLSSGQVNDATLQGISEMPYNLVGAPADVAAMVMRPFGYTNPTPTMGSDWIKQQMTRLGIRPEPPTQPTARAMYEMGQIGSSMVNPAAPVRGAVRAAEKTGEAAKMLARDFQDYNRQLAAPGASYVSRPAGGEFPTAPVGQAPRSSLDTYIENLADTVRGRDEAAMPSEKSEAAVEFFDKKLRSFFRSQAGSVSDPVREAIISGKIKFKKDTPEEEMFPQALIDAARKGDVTAMRALENTYDKSMGVKAYRLRPEGEGYQGADDAQAAYKQSILAQMKATPTIIPDAMLLRMTTKNADTLPPAEAAKRVADIRAKMAENPAYFSVVLEPKMERLLAQNPMESVTKANVESFPNLYRAIDYTAKNPGTQGIASLSATERPVLDIFGSYLSPLGLSERNITDVISDLSVKDLKQMSVPEFFAKALVHKGRTSELDSYVEKAGQLVRANAPVPPKIAFYGTKEFMPPDAQGMQWREITDPMATRLHGEMLGNSIGGYSRMGTYGALSKGRASLEDGQVRLFGLYDKDNRLVTNVEYVTPEVKAYNSNAITQFYGNGPRTGNVAPENYLPQVEAFIRKLNPDTLPPSISKLLMDAGRFIND